MKNLSSTPMGSMSAKRVSLRQVGKQLIVTERVKKRTPNTGKVQQAKERFLDAAFYGSKQSSDPASKAYYEQGITEKKKSAYAVAMSDYLVAPQVEFINVLDYKGNVGDLIAIRAKDDFRVVRVKVEIFGADGSHVEDGDAETDDSARNLWKYRAKALNATLPGTTIRATAIDTPGNTGSLENVI